MRVGSTNLELHIRYIQYFISNYLAFRGNTALKCTATLDLYLCMISHIMISHRKTFILIGVSTAVVKHRIKEITRFYLIEIIKIEK